MVSRSARSGGVLDVAQALLRATLDLLCLAFGLLRPVAGQLAESFLDLARGLVDRAFGTLACHLVTPLAVLAQTSCESDGSWDSGLDVAPAARMRTLQIGRA